jgi:type IV secretory pathway TraG/TraD family ATPase VirD4
MIFSLALILADEFVKMGKMTQLIKTPDLSRGQKVAVIFIVQALSQPAEVYGAVVVDTTLENSLSLNCRMEFTFSSIKLFKNLLSVCSNSSM